MVLVATGLIRLSTAAAFSAIPPQPQMPMMPMRSRSTEDCSPRKSTAAPKSSVLLFWSVFSTVAAPLVIQKVIAAGELAGGQLIAGAFSSLLQTAATTAGAAAVAAPIGSPAVTAGATGMAAILSTLSTAAGHGSAGAIIIAGSGLPPRSARGRPGDDITGDKAVRELIARTKGHY